MKKNNEKKIIVSINGQVIKTEPGKTILEIANEEGIYIPTLCNDERLKPWGSCRVCIVEVEGAKTFLPSCATEAIDGMVIQTDSYTLHETRKGIIELILSDHHADCLTCEKSGQCDLQDIAYELDIEEIDYSGEKHDYTVETHNPLIAIDLNKCIRCARCVRICSEVQGCRVFDLTKRGFETEIATPFSRSLYDANCVFCGNCISSCPTGALLHKGSKSLGRSWQSRIVSTICPYCGCGCRLNLWVKDNKVINVTSTTGKGVNNGNLCIKGRFGFDFISHEDRLTFPLIKKSGHFEQVSWDEAYDYIAKRLADIKEKHGPDSIGGLASAKCTNEDNYVFQRFMRAVIGTNNVDHCARL